MTADSPAGMPLPANRWDLLDGRWPEQPPHVSVIVAHYRQPEQLARTLAALRSQDHPAELLQIIVADDGSPEPPSVPDGVELVHHEDRGFRLAAVRNLGAAAARGDVLVFLDADTAPEPAFIRELTRLPALAPDCVTVGRRRHADLRDVDATRLAEEAARRALPEPDWLAAEYRRTANLLHADDRSYRYVIGAVIACSRMLFDATGGFDESFTAYGGEDWEWTYRAWLRGALLAHVPAAVAWHDGPDAAGRDEGAVARRNAEAIRLSDLIPVAGSAGRALRPTHPDIAIIAPPHASAGQRFLALDSTLAALGPASNRAAVLAEDSERDAAFDRVRVVVELLRPVRVDADADVLAASLARMGDEALGEVTLRSPDGEPLVRMTSTRARTRSERWHRDDLFPTASVTTAAIRVVTDEPDLAAYLGGWG
ncbi:putative glycosyltransferase [Microbacterium sp. TS-1]|uniref:glycosyltransferase n=1 Tax=Microbacterium sp. TS-1 TaxID=1344956 RepID=UPI00038F73D2|nr:glycosyltransferase [Microbacterium sp. TS-1]GAD33900.1 putative glycosyltransferase [Microbacterium sp. TS-1]